MKKGKKEVAIFVATYTRPGSKKQRYKTFTKDKASVNHILEFLTGKKGYTVERIVDHHTEKTVWKAIDSP